MRSLCQERGINMIDCGSFFFPAGKISTRTCIPNKAEDEHRWGVLNEAPLPHGKRQKRLKVWRSNLFTRVNTYLYVKLNEFLICFINRKGKEFAAFLFSVFPPLDLKTLFYGVTDPQCSWSTLCNVLHSITKFYIYVI